jgi:hypothetical protein
MIADNWLLILGVPIIIVLVIQAGRQVIQIRARIAQVRDEMARSPLPPFAQLAQLMEEQKAAEGTDGKRAH